MVLHFPGIKQVFDGNRVTFIILHNPRHLLNHGPDFLDGQMPFGRLDQAQILQEIQVGRDELQGSSHFVGLSAYQGK